MEVLCVIPMVKMPIINCDNLTIMTEPQIPLYPTKVRKLSTLRVSYLKGLEKRENS